MPRIPRQIQELSNEHHRRLLAFTEDELERLGEIAARVRRALTIRLASEPLSARSFRAQQQRVALILSEVVLAALRDVTQEQLMSTLASSTVLGYLDALTEVENWGAYYGLELRAPDLAASLRFGTNLRLEQYQTSLQTYGLAGAQRVRQVLEDAAFTFESKEQVIRQVMDAVSVENWRAARIVRTETLGAYNGAFQQTLVEARDQGWPPNLQKSAVVTFDSRTAQDSLPLNGQVRDLEDLFVDGVGRRYLSPPGRPNDREKQIPWMPATMTPEEILALPEPGAPEEVVAMAERVANTITGDVNAVRDSRGLAPLPAAQIRDDVQTLVEERAALFIEP